MQETADMPARAGIRTTLEEVFKSIIDHAGAKTVYGEPVTLPGKTIIPVAKIRYGFGGGSGSRAQDQQHGGGGGGGFVAQPMGVVEITPSQTRFIPISSFRTMAAAVGIGICLGFLAVWSGLGRRH